MSKLFLTDQYGNRKETISLTGLIAQGAAGTVHHLANKPGHVVKIYKNINSLSFYKEKISAMLSARPNLPDISYNGKSYVQIAWPTSMVFDEISGFVGFMMPEVDITSSTELENVLQKKARKNLGIPEDYSLRVRLAANLSALIAELHKLNHYMIDMKPINLRCYPDVQYMAILDTDGFSINGPKRFNADQFSDEYISPEAKGTKPETLGEEQDLFALATIIFRLMNNGLHPYQGIDNNQNHPSSLQDRIFAGLYAYGLNPNPIVKPSLQSIHSYLEDDTRRLFDRAFQISKNRPKASEWRDHLKDLIINKRLKQCKKIKEHGHFSKKCGYCELDKINNQLSPTKLSGKNRAFINKLAKTTQPHINSPTTAISNSTYLSSILSNFQLNTLILYLRGKINPGYLIIAIILFFGYLADLSEKNKVERTNTNINVNDYAKIPTNSPLTSENSNNTHLPLGSMRPQIDINKNGVLNNQPIQSEVSTTDNSSNTELPKEQIWVALYTNKKSIEARKDNINFQWVASPNTTCLPIFPKDFTKTRNQPGIISGSFRIPGEKNITVKCVGSGQITEQNTVIIVTEPSEITPPSTTKEIGSGTGGIY